MDAAALRAMQAPLKERYKGDPKSAFITLKAKGSLDDAHIACKVDTGRALAMAGLHPATGGSRLRPFFGGMLLPALAPPPAPPPRAGAAPAPIPAQTPRGAPRAGPDFRRPP